MASRTQEETEGRGLLAPMTASPLDVDVDDTDPRRRELRQWLAEHPHPDGRTLADAGLVAPQWPAPWGRDADAAYQLLIADELNRAGVVRPINPIGIGWAGPTILFAGTREQRDRWLPGLLSGDEFWCQLFSEPGAGSDLAALTTSAHLDGDEWVITGQKVWTSYAHIATWGILLARTSTDGPAQRGISYFVCPMKAPGVTVRPIIDMTGDHAFNEVFLDGVRLPADLLVGEVNNGWSLAKVTLGNERVSLSGEGALWGQGPTAGDLVDLVREAGGTSDARLRQRLVQVWAEGEILRLIRLRTVSAAVAGRAPGPEASVRKALADDHGQHVMEVAKDLSGAYGLTDAGPLEALGARRAADGQTVNGQSVDGRSAGGGPPAGAGHRWPPAIWSHGYLFARALTIGGGTAEVQRNIIAERVLGLPSS